MKNTVKTNAKKQKIKKKPLKVHTKNRKERVLIVAQEIKFARLLSGNEKKTRDRVLKSLKKWLVSCFAKNYEFKEDDFIRVWKGLFYAVWMSDKPLIQEELCESIAAILDIFPPDQIHDALLMARAGFRVLATEWYGIDQHRMDKFLMLVRRYLRGSLRCLQRCEWSLDSCELYANMLSTRDGILSLQTPLYARNATSMLLHFVDCFLEELNKLCAGSLPDESFAALLRPFCSYVCRGAGGGVGAASRRLLTTLVRDSGAGVEYRERQQAWQAMGCPEGGPDALELVTADDDDHSDGDDDGQSDDDPPLPPRPPLPPLDPRAGRVDVVLAAWRVPSMRVASMLRDLLAGASSRAHRRLKICLQRFEQLSQNKYPLPLPASVTEAVEPKKKSRPIRSLRNLDAQLANDADELALRGLSRKHRKRLLASSRAGQDIVEQARALHYTNNGTWHVEDTSPPEKVSEEKHNNKENKKKTPNTNNKENKKKSSQTTDNKDKIDTNKNQQRDNKKRKHVDRIPDKNNKKQKLQVKTEQKPKKQDNSEITKKHDIPKVNYQKQIAPKPKSPNKPADKKTSLNTPKKVKFVLKNNSMQQPIDYYKSVRQSPNIPFDSSRTPSKTNLKVSTPSPINPFFKKKLRMKN